MLALALKVSKISRLKRLKTTILVTPFYCRLSLKTPRHEICTIAYLHEPYTARKYTCLSSCTFLWWALKKSTGYGLASLGHFLTRVKISGRSHPQGPKYGFPKKLIWCVGYNCASKFPHDRRTLNKNYGAVCWNRCAKWIVVIKLISFITK